MGMGKKHARRILTRLKEIRKESTMERADFGGSVEAELPKSRDEVTVFIKKTTRLYRTSWLIEPLDEIIKEFRTYI